MRHGRDPEILLDPPPNFTIEILANGRDRIPDYSFVGNHPGLASPSDALLLWVVPEDAEPWTGRFEGGYRSPSAVTTVRTGPRPDLLLVVNKGAGFLVPVDDPDSAIELELGPVVGVAVSREDDTFVAADFTHLAGFRPEGRRWIAEVSWDGVELDGIEGGVVHGRGWDAPRGRKTDFALDVRDGRILRGVTPRP
ncbi:MAG TPA: hypothetical protein VGO81_11955 [Solirubrobacteraceae bacterium]|jgi:hypothetical protein|nr:hypothetical protein [Solirubrobacteraceae bacterium]